MTQPSTVIADSVVSAPSSGFCSVHSELTYHHMQEMRTELGAFLEREGLRTDAAGNVLLAVTEVLSNLVRHPVQKATHVELRATVADGAVTIDISDNSTPFADFDTRIAAAQAMRDVTLNGGECGYGLGCVLAVCAAPVYRPAPASPDALNHFTLRHRSVAPSPPVSAAQEKIFLIDDDPVSLQIYSRMLAGVYDVVAFDKAEDAVAAFARHRPHLVISDLIMPGMDGIALRRALSVAEGGDATPFVFLSGQAQNENNSYISRLGIDDFLTKPITRDRLLIVVSRLLRRSRQVRDSIEGKFHHDITALMRPTLPERWGLWSFHVRHAAAESGGGDFIVHSQSVEALGAVLTDVMGHGRQAKFFACAYAGYLHGMFRLQGAGLEPGGFLRQLSRHIDGDLLLESTAMTCQALQFFPDGACAIASAGHPPPLHLSSDAPTAVDVSGPLPGLAGDSVYDTRTVRLNPGEALLVMTDGFLDVFDRRGRATEILTQCAAALPPLTAAARADALWEEFSQRQKKQISGADDATLILAEYGAQT